MNRVQAQRAEEKGYLHLGFENSELEAVRATLLKAFNEELTQRIGSLEWFD